MNLKDDIIIKKSSGEYTNFSEYKLIKSLEKSGADPDTIEYIIKSIEKSLYKGITTKKIYQIAYKLLKLLRKRNVASRYKLKTAIMELGPSGFPFEIYVSELFKSQGYEVKLDQILPGQCITHEIDVFAKKEKDVGIVECKFHNRSGFICGIQVPLYVHSRFQDVKSKLIEREEYKDKNFNVWIVTNTRFSEDSIKYSEYYGLNLVGWDYPSRLSLKSIADKFNLYPITALTSLTKPEKLLLLEEKIVLCNTLYKDRNNLSRLFNSSSKVKNILEECENLIFRK